MVRYIILCFVCEQLDKVYDPNAPEDDMMERFEEMNRMREHVMNEIDKDHDKLISLDEFLDSTKTAEFKKDEGWDVSIFLVDCFIVHFV
jgi:hypothetical protein